jgi:hypothetical protein
MSGVSDESPAWWRDPAVLAELFLASNVGFLAVDILSAHAINSFAKPAEWIPVVFSVVAAGMIVLSWLVNGGVKPVLKGRGGFRQAVARGMGYLVGWGAIVVGGAGLVYHLESQFFRDRTIASLVYTAPFVAPLAYSGLGLLAILNRKVDARTPEWVVLLAMGGFAGNFVLCLADHAQNGFFHPAEWAGVVAGAFGVSTLAGVLAAPANRPMRGIGWGVMGMQVVVGMAGAGYHVAANLGKGMPAWWENFVFGAPAFAPLLFADLAGLGALGLYAMARAVPVEAEARAVAA